MENLAYEKWIKRNKKIDELMDKCVNDGYSYILKSESFDMKDISLKSYIKHSTKYGDTQVTKLFKGTAYFELGMAVDLLILIYGNVNEISTDLFFKHFKFDKKKAYDDWLKEAVRNMNALKTENRKLKERIAIENRLRNKIINREKKIAKLEDEIKRLNGLVKYYENNLKSEEDCNEKI